MNLPALCELRGIRKTFTGVRALDGVDLEVLPGEIQALVGENGAGKSTLIRILTGVLAPDSGQVLFRGSPAAIGSPGQARRLGIAAAHQDPELFSFRSAIENCFNQRGLPGWPFISFRTAAREARAALERLGAGFPAERAVWLLSPAERQVVALAGAFLASPRLLILDEPTAALGAAESEKLFRILRELRAAGTSIIYVSHRLGEVLSMSDRVTVLRDGRRVWTRDTSGIDGGALIEAMVGRRLEGSYPRSRDPGASPPALSAASFTDGRGAFREVTFTVRRGEVLGLYGLVGAGRSELGQALAGLRRARGRLKVEGRIAYLPQDRLNEGNLSGLGLRENLAISAAALLWRGPLIDRRRERKLASAQVDRLSIRAAGLEEEIESLSGGNQQKALLGRALLTEPDVLVLDEPTQGIDVGARAEVHSLIAGLARAGRAVVLISSDLPEVLGLSHRVAVLREGRLVLLRDSAGASEEELGLAAFPHEEKGGRGGRERPGGARSLLRALGEREAALVLAILAVALATEWESSGFLSLKSARDIAADSAPLALAALGQTLVIASGAIDISVGAMLALCAAAATLWAERGGSVPAAVALAVLLGIALGSLNVGISRLGRLHPLVTTLGTMGLFHGAFILWTGGDWLFLPEPLLDLASRGPLGIPLSVWGAVAAAALVFACLRWTRLGRACLKVGDNPRAARTHGLPAGLARWLAFGILGGCMGLAGVFHAARYGKVQSNTGTGFELLCIAAAVLGGAHVTGGRGTVPGALLGAALIGLLQAARAVWGIHERWQLVLVGVLMLLALVVESFLSRIFREEKR